MKYSKNDIWIALLAFMWCLLPINAQGPNNSIKLPDGRIISAEQLETKIESAMDSLKYPGLSIAIINNNEIVYSNGFGLANRETKEAVTNKTIFQGASLSKPLFAYFMMKMVEEHQMDLDAPIYPYLKPIFPEGVIEEQSFEAYKTLTPRMVLSHTTGIPNWTKGQPISIAFKPGTDFSYSGEAYQHLGAAFALKQGMDWGVSLDSLIKDKALHAMGMERSFYVWDENFNAVTARGHVGDKMLPEIKKYKKVGPGFSLHSNAQDYALFLMEMLAPKHIKTSTRDLMLKEQIHFGPDNELYKETGQTGWGLGFAQKQTANGLIHLHTGKNPGFECYAMFMPEHDYGLVMFGNANDLFPLLRSIETLIGEHF